MLETIREFGLEQLAASGEEDAVRAHHAGAFLATVRALRPLASIRARHAPADQVAAEQANLRTALEWLERHGPAADFVELTAAVGMAGYVYGLYEDGQPWLEQALDRIEEARPADQARLLIGYAGVLFARGELSRAAALVERSRNLLQTVDEPLDEAVALTLRGAIRNGAGEYAAAEEPLHAALAVAERIHDPLLQAGVAGRAHGNLSLSARGQHDFARAATHGEAALGHYAGQRLDLAEALMHLSLGAITFDAEQPSLAAEHWHTGLIMKGDRGDMRNLADALSGIASLATLRQDDRSALLLLGAAEALRERVGSAMRCPIEIANAEQSLAQLRSRIGAQRVTTLLSEGLALSLSDAIQLARAITADAMAGVAGTSQSLTRREQDVLRLMSAGQTDREIAEALYISRRTVNGHVRSILAKLGCATRAEAVARAGADGIIE